MIELTEQQLQDISSAGKDPAFEAGLWTMDEMNLLADEAADIISREENHEP